MQGWQVAYHLIFVVTSVAAFAVLRWRRGREYGCLILSIPLLMATAAEIFINSLWPEMLASSSTAGVGLVIAWAINVLLGLGAWLLVLSYPERK